MVSDLENMATIFILASVPFQAVTAYYCYRIGKLTGAFLSWNLILLGMVIIAANRLYASIQIFAGAKSVDPLSSGIALAGSVILAVGFYMMYRVFQRKIGKQDKTKASVPARPKLIGVGQKQ